MSNKFLSDEQLRTLAKSEGLIISEAEIDKSAGNLMGYVAFLPENSSYKLLY